MRHELLAPAGSPEICRAVIAAGADAVYLGGEKYGARAFAQNFSEEEILSALDHAHLHGRKIFLTVNTLLKNREMGKELFDYLNPFYEHGLDAIIVQDFGVFQFVRTYFPELPVHVSTQMSVSNVYGASLLQKCGAARIVTARELSLGEIRRIREQTGVEIESFIHGALCYCYSGQCLMSSLIGGRSGNRGRCAQPCRLPYQVEDEEGACLHKKESYPLSMKDLCALDRIPQLCEAGIYSFKIEGRMKSLEYAAGVTQVYRKYLDLYEASPDRFCVNDEDYRYLLALGNRNGFTRGYYEMRNGRSMVTLTDSSHASVDAKGVYRPVTPEKIPIAGRLTVRQGDPLSLTVRTVPGARCGSMTETAVSRETTVSGEIVSAAQKRPLSHAEVYERICKTGETPFVFISLEVNLAENCFVPVRQLNELRRNALCQLEQSMLHSHRRTLSEQYGPKALKEQKTASCDDVRDGGNPGRSSGEPGRSSEHPGRSSEHPGRSRGDSDRINRQNGRDQSYVLNVQVSSHEQMEEALRYPFVDMISLDFCFLPEKGDAFDRNDACGAGKKLRETWFRSLEQARRRIVSAGKQAAFCFPYIFRENTSVFFEKREMQELICRFDTVWVRSYDSLGFCLQALRLRPEQISLDAPLYICSEEAYAAFSDIVPDKDDTDFRSRFGFRQYTASPELNKRELAHMPNDRAQFCLYGSVPVMISAQCVYKNYRQCMKNGDSGATLCLSDRYNKKFPVFRDCMNCYNLIYNSVPTYLFHQAEAVKKSGFASYRISFAAEDREQVCKILEDYRLSFPEGKPVLPPDSGAFTNGHFQRGVE
ncbi:MAG: U32 family peptidase [Clostridiales bacterium]|nr:U32 family peptidase [Clostridiales bacterium]